MKDTYKKSFILLVLFFGTTLLYSQAFISANEKQSNIEESKLNEMDIPQESYCNNIKYESAKLHTLKNIESIDNLEKNSVDFYASVRSLYFQDRERKISNSNASIENIDDSDWEEIDTK